MMRGSATPDCLVDGCNRTPFSRGWCQMHYTRWLRHGDPLAEHRSKGSPYERVIARTIRVGDCLVFQGTLPNGYGAVRVGRKMKKAHRVVMEHHHGHSTLDVLHSCDNPPCVEINHLRYGTAAENVADRDERNGVYPISNQWGDRWPRRGTRGGA